MKENSPTASAHDIAARIYVELVARNAQVAEGSVEMAVSAANLAEMSLRLAEVFTQAQSAATAAKEPMKDYKLDGDDIASWSKK